MKTYYFPIILLMIVMSCSSTDVIQPVPARSSFVVEGYLVANQREATIRVSTLNGTSDAEPLAGTSVQLIRNGATYFLKDENESGTYRYHDNSFIITSGDTFNLLVATATDTAFGTTIVPERPVNVSVSSDTLYKDSLYVDFDGQKVIWNFDYHITIQWDVSNDQNGLYYFTLESENGSLQVLPHRNDDTDPNMAPQPNWHFAEYPVGPYLIDQNRNTVEIEGNYRAIISRVNQDIIDLYNANFNSWTREHMTYSNIENGYGIFTSMACDTVEFYVKDFTEEVTYP
jgi:hypothetical protein